MYNACVVFLLFLVPAIFSIECQNFSYNNSCYDVCPEQRVHFPPNKTCLLKCPGKNVTFERICLEECPFGYCSTYWNKTCFKCEAKRKNTKTCRITEYVSRHNINDLTSCVTVHGSIKISDETFSGVHLNTRTGTFTFYDPLKVGDLWALQSIQRVTGYVYLEASTIRNNTLNSESHKITSMNFLQNLRVIEGKELTFENSSLRVVDSYTVRELGLTSLYSIENGRVMIANNSKLCFVDSLPWASKIVQGGARNVLVTNNSKTCAKESRVCDLGCEYGCWSNGTKNCFNLCPTGYYSAELNGTHACEKCHDYCTSCTSKGTRVVSNGCKCRDFVLKSGFGEDSCVPRCSGRYTYLDARLTDLSALGTCRRCYPTCYGCFGPSADQCVDCIGTNYTADCELKHHQK